MQTNDPPETTSHSTDGNWDDMTVYESARTLSPEGLFPSVAAAVLNGGLQASQFKPEGRRTLFVCHEFVADGVRHSQWKRYTMTLDSKGHLLPLIVAALGRAFPRTTGGGFDPRLLVGRNVMVEVEHHSKGGKTYADIVSVTRCPAGVERIKPTPGITPPQWVLDAIAKRLDKPATAAGTTAGTSNPAADPNAGGDGIDAWRDIGFCQGDGDDGEGEATPANG